MHTSSRRATKSACSASSASGTARAEVGKQAAKLARVQGARVCASAVEKMRVSAVARAPGARAVGTRGGGEGEGEVGAYCGWEEGAAAGVDGGSGVAIVVGTR